MHGSDSVLSVCTDGRVPVGVIALEEAQRHNMHLVGGESFTFTPFVHHQSVSYGSVTGAEQKRLLQQLVDVTIEVRLRLELLSPTSIAAATAALQSTIIATALFFVFVSTFIFLFDTVASAVAFLFHWCGFAIVVISVVIVFFFLLLLLFVFAAAASFVLQHNEPWGISRQLAQGSRQRHGRLRGMQRRR